MNIKIRQLTVNAAIANRAERYTMLSENGSEIQDPCDTLTATEIARTGNLVDFLYFKPGTGNSFPPIS